MICYPGNLTKVLDEHITRCQTGVYKEFVEQKNELIQTLKSKLD